MLDAEDLVEMRVVDPEAQRYNVWCVQCCR